jgi:hypothetical protein
MAKEISVSAVGHLLKAIVVIPSQPPVLAVISHGRNVEAYICRIQLYLLTGSHARQVMPAETRTPCYYINSRLLSIFI